MKALLEGFSSGMLCMAMGGLSLSAPAIVGIEVSYAAILGTSLVWAGLGGLALLIRSKL